MIEYTVKVDEDGSKFWYLNGQRHREDGPAVEWANGSKRWYLNGLLHREDGPAVEWADGDKFWYLNNQLHREEEFNRLVAPAQELTVAEISKLLGYEIKIVK